MESTSKDQHLTGTVLKNAHASITPDENVIIQRLAEKDPVYQKFASEQQKQKEAQLVTETSSQISSQETPPSAFAAFKGRLENENQKQASQNPVVTPGFLIAHAPSTQENPRREKEGSSPSSKIPLPSQKIRQ